MADDDIVYLGEVRMFGGTSAPNGWAFCNGQLLPINENTPLFSLIGTSFGGDGLTNFALPDLRGRVPVHSDFSTLFVGQNGGAEQVSLSQDELPAHTHLMVAATNGGSDSPSGNLWAPATGNVYANVAGNVQMSPANTTPIGKNTTHNNMTPFACIGYLIALVGVFPSHGEEGGDAGDHGDGGGRSSEKH